MNHYGLRQPHQAGHRCNVPDEIEIEIFVKRGVDRVCRTYHEQGISVRGRAYHSFGRQIAGSADLVLNHELLAEPLREPLTYQACSDVRRGAGRKTDDNAHRPRRIGLRLRYARHHRQRGNARGEMQKLTTGKFHGVLPDHFAEIKLGAALTATLITSTAFRMLAGRSAPTLPMKRIRHAPLAARLICYLSIELMRKGLHFRKWPILLQNSLKDQWRSDSVMLMRIGGAGYDGAEKPGPGAAVLFVQSGRGRAGRSSRARHCRRP